MHMKCPALLNLFTQPRFNIYSSLDGTAWIVCLSLPLIRAAAHPSLFFFWTHFSSCSSFTSWVFWSGVMRANTVVRNKICKQRTCRQTSAAGKSFQATHARISLHRYLFYSFCHAPKSVRFTGMESNLIPLAAPRGNGHRAQQRTCR